MISAIVSCTNSDSVRACHSLLMNGIHVIGVGNEQFMPDECACKVTNESTDRWARWNHGIDIAIAMGYTEFVLISDNCIPQAGIVQSHENALRRDLPLISIGRCLDQKYDWRDRRNQLFLKDGSLVANVSLVSGNMIACGNIGMNLRAVRRMQQLHSACFGINATFLDNFGARLGYAAWLMHITMWFLPSGQNAVKVTADYSYDADLMADEPYVSKIRATHISLDMLV